MPKRKSGNDQDPKKTKQQKGEVKVKVNRPPYVENMIEWIVTNVLPAGGGAAYLSAKYNTKALKVEFAEWLDSAFPANPRKSYCTSLDVPGPCLLRPFQLAWRPDFGLAGSQEPDQLLAIAELVAAESFRTDADLGGTEKVSIAQVTKEFLESDYEPLNPLHNGSLVPPFHVAYIKGWRRCLTLLVCCQDSFGTIHATILPHKTLKAKIWANRGFTMQSLQRRAAHCFNLLRQIRVLQQCSKTGDEDPQQHFDDWESETSVCRAFQIGKTEAKAVVQLHSYMDPSIKEELEGAVNHFGMRAFIFHDVIAKECFSRGFTSATQGLEEWAAKLTNGSNSQDPLATLFTKRVISDFKRAGEGQRKPLNFKDALYKHQVCGAYLHFKSEFQSRCPEKEWPTLSQEIDDSFYQRLLDTDLHAAMLSSVPPGDLLAISSFRPHLGRFQKVQVAELEAKEDRLARSVLEATFNQLSAQLDHDMALVKEKLCHDKDAEAVESAKDARFLRERQLKGAAWVKNWMARHCVLIPVDDSMSGSMTEYASFNAQFQGSAGRKFTVVGLDATLWPSNSPYLSAAVQTACGITNMSENTVCHAQLPQLQSSTSNQTVLKHRRSLEDQLVNQKLDVSTVMLLRFQKPDSQRNDTRRASQPCVAATSTNYKTNGFLSSDAMQTSTIGPVPLIKTSLMLGYDQESGSMSAGLRTEQKGVPCHVEILKAYASGLDLTPADIYIFVDVLPNRHCEFGRAAVASILDSTLPQLRYMGYVKKDFFSKVHEAISSTIYTHWDASRESGPQQRPRESGSVGPLGLKVLAVSASGQVVWPDSLLSGYPSDSAEYKALEAKRAAFLEMRPQVQTSSQQTTVRSTARPDFSIEGGKEPLDHTRMVDLAGIPAGDFTGERLATSPGKSNRPTVVITQDWHVWVGNENSEDLALEAMPLFGFGLGDYEDKVVEGDGVQDVLKRVVPWKMTDDKALVCYNGSLTPLCCVLHKMSSDHGLVDVQILDHKHSPKMRTAVDGQEPVPAPFRFHVEIQTGGKTHCFRPSSLDGQDMMNVKHHSLGQVLKGNFNRLGSNQRAGLVWEVQSTTSVPPKVLPVKPKFWLTCSTVLAGNTWYQLTSCA